ncbi:MAG: aminotransferase class I/II-fold pyridoxal phosphate-dependent enzyme [Planctomycetota bacterium]|nr:aminotransferase class I/II-fold pyridoxal phosphate-dependent enzyme [Planctomycetota bacterium]
MSGLAALGGDPLFAVPQHVGGPIVEPETRERFHRLADGAFTRNHLTNNGPLATRLEEEVARRHACGDAVFVANATLAQMILMKALGLESGEAVVSANTFVATAHACGWLGVRPVFCDIDPVTLNLDPVDAERRLTEQTRAVIPTHVFGVFADMESLSSLCRRHNLILFADAAHAFDCTRGKTFAGGFGAPEFLSFHATKYFSSLEGGAILTGDSSLAAELRAVRNFGFNRPGDSGLSGINAKGSEISAAFGLASLPALPERRRRLRAIHDVYRKELAGIAGLRIHDVDAAGRNNYRYFSLFVEEDFPLRRDVVWQVLRRENIMVRRYFHPGCHRMTFYKERDGGGSLPVADKMLGAILSLPTSFVETDPIKGAEAIARRFVTMVERHGEIMDWWEREGKLLPLAE